MAHRSILLSRPGCFWSRRSLHSRAPCGALYWAVNRGQCCCYLLCRRLPCSTLFSSLSSYSSRSTRDRVSMFIYCFTLWSYTHVMNCNLPTGGWPDSRLIRGTTEPVLIRLCDAPRPTPAVHSLGWDWADWVSWPRQYKGARSNRQKDFRHETWNPCAT